jgi:hypothetical protein
VAVGSYPPPPKKKERLKTKAAGVLIDWLPQKFRTYFLMFPTNHLQEYLGMLNNKPVKIWMSYYLMASCV